MDRSRLCSNNYFFWRRRAIRFTDDKDTAVEITAFSDGKSTQQFLARYTIDRHAMIGLRSLLSESQRWIDVSRLTADQVVAEVTRLILAGELGVALRPRVYTIGSSPIPVSGAMAAAPAANPLATSKSQEPDPATFSPSLNALAQAAALSAAAASGVAFCAQCK
jgi:hypothetical protein